MKALELNPILLLDARNGIYNPKLLAEMIIEGSLIVKNKKEITKYLFDLGNVENEFYWDSYLDLSDRVVLLDKWNNEFYLTENDGDIWCIPMGFDFDNFFE
jgi:hypothetical protein